VRDHAAPLITGAVLLGAAEASRGWEAVLPVTALDHVQQHGPSGAGIWSSPTIDEQTGRPVHRYGAPRGLRFPASCLRRSGWPPPRLFGVHRRSAVGH
jgi:hypothetical protein